MVKKSDEQIEGQVPKNKFRKSDLGIYEDEAGYEALLKAYQENEENN